MVDRVENLTIGAFARAAGVNVETVRYYQRRGLLLEPRKPLGGIRRYGESDVARLGFIKTAQRLGFTLEEVALLLKLDDGTHCSEAAAVAQHKLAEVRARLADLNRMDSVLSALVARCRKSRGHVSCPLISSLRSAPDSPRSHRDKAYRRVSPAGK
ncbi:MAG: Hg(II)-responsive transcriptional regulator [Betaproteobacteria bacterium]|nr:Hg(II)-responsive transcriptional regulator [Betaproteobacteria bacterium]MBI2961874.1 Hg(II)-responsive transcriptional regulator [Betaproteobacteria bacterium]